MGHWMMGAMDNIVTYDGAAVDGVDYNGVADNGDADNEVADNSVASLALPKITGSWVIRP